MIAKSPLGEAGFVADVYDECKYNKFSNLLANRKFFTLNFNFKIKHISFVSQIYKRYLESRVGFRMGFFRGPVSRIPNPDPGSRIFYF